MKKEYYFVKKRHNYFVRLYELTFRCNESLIRTKEILVYFVLFRPTS